MNWTAGLILTCFFFSGASGLLYEVIWLRMLVLVFGSTTLAVSTVLTAFMAGLGLGSLWFGRLVDRWPRPLLAYGLLEIGIGLYGALIPWLFPLLVPVYQWIWGRFDPSFYAFNLLRFALALGILLLPTTLMGATLPVLASFYAGRKSQPERRIGLLYGLNTTGAVLGTFATGFILLPALGVMKSTLVAAALNLMLGTTAMLLSRERTRLKVPSAMRTDRDGADRPPGPRETKPSFVSLTARGAEDEPINAAVVALVLAAFAVSGYTAMVYEVAWTRVLTLVLGSSVYAFSAMLSTFLLGLAAGSLLFSRLLSWIRRPIWTLALVQAAIGLSGYLTSVLLQRLPYFFLQALDRGLPIFQAHPDWLIEGLWFSSTLAVMLVPTLLFGGTFPLVVKVYHLYCRQTGRTAGDAYFANTLGAILGSFLGGFALIPLLGIRWTLLLNIFTNLTLAFILVLAIPFRKKALQAGAALTLLVLGVGLAAWKIPWNPAMMTFNLGIEYPTYLKLVREEGIRDWRDFQQKMTEGLDIEFYEEGASATVTVVRDTVGHHYLKNDGRPEGGEPYLRTHTLLGHLPLLLHSQAEEALLIGLGTGVTLGAVQQHALKDIEVVELEPAVVRAAAYFRNISRHDLTDPRLRVIINDGRNHLLVVPKKYDIIISQPSFPWLTGVANLFTKEVFELGARRLRPEGVFCQWVSVYGMTRESFASVLKAFQSAFRYVAVFDPAPPDMLLLGSNRPIRFDLSALQEAFARRPVQKDLERAGVEDPYDLLAAFALGSEEIQSLVKEAVTNTDDNAWVEVRGPRDYYTGRINGEPEAIRDRLFKTQRGIEKYLDDTGAETREEQAEQLLKLAEAYLKQESLNYASFYADRALKLKETGRGHLLMARLLAAHAVKVSMASDTPVSSRQAVLKAAIQATEAALEADPQLDEALRFQAQLHERMGNMNEAISTYERLVKIRAEDPDARYTLASLLQSAGRHQEARRHYAKFLALVKGKEDYTGLAELARKQVQEMQKTSQKTP